MTSSSSEDELDVYSMKFNPARALREGDKMIQKLPFPKTRRLDNLDKYQVIVNASDDPLDFEQNMLDSLKKRPLSRKSNKFVDPSSEASTSTQRHFLPHQMPISVPRKPLENNNLIQRMNVITGPLAKLREFRDARIRVCIKTRNIYASLLNEFVAYVVAFDKHWNLALEDVEETFTRKRRRKVPVQPGSEPLPVLTDEELLRRGFVKPVVVRRVGKKLELCKRHLPQLMLRGEHVVLVTPAM